MLRKMFLVVLIVVMSLSVIGCGDVDTTDNKITNVDKVDKETDKVDESDEDEKTKETKDVEDVEDVEETEASFEEVVFVDDENCMFKITGIEEDDIFGYTLKADLENKSDKNMMFSIENASVNGYMCDPFWATSVQSGKKAKSDISFSNSSLEELGIEEVEEIEFTLRVYDEDDWMADSFVEDTFVLTIE